MIDNHCLVSHAHKSRVYCPQLLRGSASLDACRILTALSGISSTVAAPDSHTSAHGLSPSAILEAGAMNAAQARAWDAADARLEMSPLNPSQKEAVRSALLAPGSFAQIVQGPPGTGRYICMVLAVTTGHLLG